MIGWEVVRHWRLIIAVDIYYAAVVILGIVRLSSMIIGLKSVQPVVAIITRVAVPAIAKGNPPAVS